MLAIVKKLSVYMRGRLLPWRYSCFQKRLLLNSSASAARSSLNVLPYEPILSYLLFLKIVYNNIPRILGLAMDLKHLNLKMQHGASLQREDALYILGISYALPTLATAT